MNIQSYSLCPWGALEAFMMYSLFQICVRCPFDYGIMDGLMLLLCEMLVQVKPSYNFS